MTSSPFLSLIMSTLGPGLSTEPAVREYVDAYPEFHQKIRELSQAVSAAGVRVRDFGLLRSEFDGNLRVFAPEEIWMFDLAVDVIAMLGCVQGLSNASLAQFRETSARSTRTSQPTPGESRSARPATACRSSTSCALAFPGTPQIRSGISTEIPICKAFPSWGIRSRTAQSEPGGPGSPHAVPSWGQMRRGEPPQRHDVGAITPTSCHRGGSPHRRLGEAGPPRPSWAGGP
jgi:hypothetical protein